MEPRVIGPDRGFTLIELVVVVAILSILTLSVTLGMNRPRAAQSQDWARFRALHDRLREQAVMKQEVLGLAFVEGGYRRVRREGADWVPEGTEGRWQAAVRIEAPFDPAEVVAFLPGGQSTPVRIRFEGDGAARTCESDGWRPVECGG